MDDKQIEKTIVELSKSLNETRAQVALLIAEVKVLERAIEAVNKKVSA